MLLNNRNILNSKKKRTSKIAFLTKKEVKYSFEKLLKKFANNSQAVKKKF